MTSADYAQIYAELGLPPLVVARNSKRALQAGWQAMPLEGVIRCLKATPQANLGIALPDGLMALDIDRKGSNGFASLEILETQHGQLPATVTQRTPSGGEHRLFRLPPGIVVKNAVGFAPGLDTRTKGGLIVVEPSMIDGKPYLWIDWSPLDGEVPEIADAPTWLLDLLIEKSQPTTSAAATGDKLLEGGRNDALFRDAAAMRRRGFDEEAITAALSVRNRNHCMPPLAEDEVRAIVASAAKYSPERDAKDWSSALTDETAEPGPGAHDPTSANVGPLESLERHLIALDSLGTPADFLPHYVEMWIPHNEVTLLAGHGGGGKSYVALSISVHVALGLPFGALTTTPTNVLFFSGEDGAEVLKLRLWRICRALQINPTQLQGRLYLLDASDIDPALHREQRVHIHGRQQIVTETILLDTLAALVQKLDAGLVVVDNASDTYDDDEIKRARVRAFVRSLRTRIARPGRAVLLLAHINKEAAKAGGKPSAEDYSGSTAWHNSVRSRLSLNPAGDDALTIDHLKANLGAKAGPMRLEWNDGVPMVAGTFISTESDVSGIIKAGEKIRDDADKVALIVLIQNFDKRGERVTTSSQGSATVYKLLKAESGFPKVTGSDRLMSLLRQLQDDGRIYRRTVKTPDRKWREVFTCVPKPQSAPILEAEAALAGDEQEEACAD